MAKILLVFALAGCEVETGGSSIQVKEFA